MRVFVGRTVLLIAVATVLSGCIEDNSSTPDGESDGGPPETDISRFDGGRDIDASDASKATPDVGKLGPDVSELPEVGRPGPDATSPIPDVGAPDVGAPDVGAPDVGELGLDASEPPADRDRDGIPDDRDNCPDSPNPDQADEDGNGVGDLCDGPAGDVDNDGVDDGDDNCQFIPNNSQRDGDEDGVGDACDNCPELPNPDQDDLCADSDEDGILDGEDNCPEVRNRDQRDQDDDGLGDRCDNCPNEANADQADQNGDGIGDVCGLEINDVDLDGIADDDDNCPMVPNVDQADEDDDGIGDRCDNCPADANNDQADEDDDGVGDACPDGDRDRDGVIDAEDNCPDIFNVQLDSDDDGLGNACDNCPADANHDQLDSDDDGRGDVCDELRPRAWITLTWGDANVDFDLHVLRPDGEYFSRRTDCWSGNRQEEWCSPGYQEDAPFNRGGEVITEEQVRLGDTDAGMYTVAVDLFFRENANQAAAMLTFNCGDEEPVSFGPQLMRSNSPADRSLWEAFRFNPVDCSVEPIDAVEALACEGNRGTDCVCEECDEAVCSPRHCPGDAECDFVSGQCMDQCADVLCPDGEFCDQQTGECLDPANAVCQPCEDASDCPDSFFCINYNDGDNPSCGLSCENGAECPDGSDCRIIRRNGRRRRACIRGDRCAEPDPCAGIECAANERCEAGECVEVPGSDRQISEWDADGPNCAEQNECAEDEECRSLGLGGDFCLLPCDDEQLGCPANFLCCSSRAFAGPSFCMADDNQLAFLCNQ